jgi:secretion/DNA translocation related TadE-like protein
VTAGAAWPRERDERGSATVLTLTLAAALLLVCLAGGAASGVLVGHRQAAAAADLAALAGATAVVEGGDPCAAARQVARRNEATLSACRVDGETVTVSARSDVPLLGGAGWSAFPVGAQARAGPVGQSP